MPVSAFKDFFFFMRRPSLVKLDLRNDLSRDPLLDEAALLKPLLSLIAELLMLPLCTIDDWLISNDDVDADDFRRKLLDDFFGTFGYLNGLNDDDGCGSIWYEQQGRFGSNEVAGWSMNADRSSKAVIAVFGVEAGTSSDFKFKLFVVVTSKSNADDSFVSILSLYHCRRRRRHCWTFCWPPLFDVSLVLVLRLMLMRSHRITLYLFCVLTIPLSIFPFFPYDIDDLLVVLWRSLFSLHTSAVSGELHAVDVFSDFDFVWDVVA